MTDILRKKIRQGGKHCLASRFALANGMRILWFALYRSPYLNLHYGRSRGRYALCVLMPPLFSLRPGSLLEIQVVVQDEPHLYSSVNYVLLHKLHTFSDLRIEMKF